MDNELKLKLLPCPFCGFSKPIISYYIKENNIYLEAACLGDDCGACISRRLFPASLKDMIIFLTKTWNKRA